MTLVEAGGAISSTISPRVDWEKLSIRVHQGPPDLENQTGELTMEPTTYEVVRGKLTVPLPVEPLFTRAEVLMLVPCKLGTLNAWIVRHKNEMDGPYFYGQPNRAVRLFSAGDVRRLRASLIRRHRHW
jgi:hypothetical protein